MLTELHIKNLAVIEQADVSFDGGFNVLTGETGAGKSILIDAIGAVLGGRVSRDLVRTGAGNALVNAVFTGVDAADWFAENDLEPEEELIVQRRIGSDGKSACRVCGAPVTAQQLRALGTRLLDIHGQNDGRQLLDEARHLEYLDRFAVPTEAKAAYDAVYDHYRTLRKEIDRLRMDDLEKARRTESLSECIRELEQAKLREGEEAELTARQSRMRAGEKLTAALEGAWQALYEADSSAISLARDAEHFLRTAADMAPELAEAVNGVSQARFLLEDAAERANDLRESMDFSEAEYDALENRLSLLRRLERRYDKEDEAGLVALLEDSRKRLDALESAGDLMQQLEKDAEKARRQVLEAGAVLTERRAAAAETLSQRVQEELKYLGMPSVRFVAELTPKDGGGFDATGCDEVRFLMSANAGAAPGRIAHIASGGELSRIMLAMKSVFAEKDPVGTLIFDEIDTGVSGVTAQRVGEKMGSLSRKRQLICITHLPQIAAMADSQYRIQKQEDGGRTFTTVTRLDRAGRVRELARLHGGDAVTDTTLKSAEEQLSAADAFKAAARTAMETERGEGYDGAEN